jgi:flagellar biosynthesis protein FliR
MFLLAFIRIVSYLSVVPFFGGDLVPARIKVGFSAALVVVMLPVLQSGLASSGKPVPLSLLMITAMAVKEAVVGFTLGFVSSLVFEVVEVAGRIVDFQRGLTVADAYAPQLHGQVSLLGQFNLQFAILVFVAIGAHRPFIAALCRSFEIVPVLGFPKLESGWSPLAVSIAGLSAQVLAAGLQLAAPAVITLLLLDLLLGLVNRAAPQINVFFLSLPIKGLAGVIVTLLTLVIFRERLVFYFSTVLKHLESLVTAIGH